MGVKLATSLGPRATKWDVPASLAGASMALGFVVWASVASPWWAIYMQNSDEGLNLGKAALVAIGTPPYGRLWNDQPPLLTYILAALQSVAPGDVAAARAVILGFGCLTIWSLYRLVHRVGGRGGAVVATVLLATSALFTTLSVSVMIGLPAIALALLAMDLAGLPRRKVPWALIAAGIAMGLSLQTKLFTLAALPALFWLAWSQGQALSWRKRSLSLLIVLLSVGATFALIVIIANEPVMTQLIGSHLDPQVRAQYSLWGSLNAIFDELKRDLPLLVALAIGVVVGWRGVFRAGIAPLLWLVVATVSLAEHTPIWSHQILLLLVPAAWLTGIAWSAFLQQPRFRTARVGVSAAALAGSAWFGFPLATAPDGWQADPGFEATRSLSHYASLGRWVGTDMPMDAFRARLLVPPELAVYSWKRIHAGNIDWTDVSVVLAAYRPSQVLFRRFGVDPHIETTIADTYRQAGSSSAFNHYIRNGALLDGISTRSLTTSLTGVLDRFIQTGVDGGYAGLIDTKTGTRYERATTQKPIAARAIVMRPSGSTPRVGACLMRLGAVTAEDRFNSAAIAAGQAVVCAQSRDGGWAPAAVLAENCSAVEPPVAPESIGDSDSLDEGGPSQAIGLLLDLRKLELKPEDRRRFEMSARAGLDFLVNAQNTDGGWPLKLSLGSYSSFSTLNDGVTTSAISSLIRGFNEFNEPRYREAAIRGAQFLLDRQSPEGAWAQQYDEAGKPVAARAFEPAAYASLESGRALTLLTDFYQLIQSPHLLAAIKLGKTWLKAREIAPDTWSRLYEIGTNRPIFGDRDGSVHYALNEISAERQAGYRWIEKFPEVIRALRQADAAEIGPAALAVAKAKLTRDEALEALLQNREALRTFASEGGATAEFDDAGMISTRKVVETCEMVLPALELSGL